MLPLLLAACHNPGSTTPTGDTGNVTTGPMCPADGVAPDAPTWSEHVAPLVRDHCAACHQDGGIAPMSLQTYEEVAPLAGVISSVVEAREMPPWLPACADCATTLAASRDLDPDQIATLRAWASAGAPEGTPIDPLVPPDLPELAEVDRTLEMASAYTPPATPSDTYRCFLLPPVSTVETHIVGYRVTPGAPSIVHHGIVFEPTSVDAEREAVALDEADDGPGWTCYGGPGVDASFVAGWAPGVGATEFPSGTGLAIAKDRGFILQIHYNVAAGPVPDVTTVELDLQDTVDHPARFERIETRDIQLPPGQAGQTASATLQLPSGERGLVWGAAPHMHELGTAIGLVRQRPSADPTCVLDLPRWDFHWQNLYLFTEPVALDAGDTVDLTCTWDTTSRTTDTVFGEGTEDEMCLAFAYVTEPIAGRGL
ncbi:MAG: hypothetical protein H6738_09245 [Alphaproteobacteria bacterium]|nr:hypothetical protein [Alphaproteobacteria bacterium]